MSSEYRSKRDRVVALVREIDLDDKTKKNVIASIVDVVKNNLRGQPQPVMEEGITKFAIVFNNLQDLQEEDVEALIDFAFMIITVQEVFDDFVDIRKELPEWSSLCRRFPTRDYRHYHWLADACDVVLGWVSEISLDIKIKKNIVAIIVDAVRNHLGEQPQLGMQEGLTRLATFFNALPQLQEEDVQALVLFAFITITGYEALDDFVGIGREWPKWPESHWKKIRQSEMAVEHWSDGFRPKRRDESDAEYRADFLKTVRPWD